MIKYIQSLSISSILLAISFYRVIRVFHHQKAHAPNDTNWRDVHNYEKYWNDFDGLKNPLFWKTKKEKKNYDEVNYHSFAGEVTVLDEPRAPSVWKFKTNSRTKHLFFLRCLPNETILKCDSSKFYCWISEAKLSRWFTINCENFSFRLNKIPQRKNLSKFFLYPFHIEYLWYEYLW